MPRFAASDLGLHCLPMSHKKYARLIRVNSVRQKQTIKDKISHLLSLYMPSAKGPRHTDIIIFYH